jgi:hypothetical protein
MGRSMPRIMPHSPSLSGGLRLTSRYSVKPGLRSLVCLLFGCMAGSVECLALDFAEMLAFELGPVKLRPSLTLAEIYNDNVYYTSSEFGKRSDFITSVSPGISLTLGRQETINPWMDFYAPEVNFINLKYRFDYQDFLEMNQLDAGNHRIEMDNRVKGNRLSLTGLDRIAMITGVLGGSTSYRQVVQRLTFTDQYTVAYQLSEKTRFYITGQDNTTDYEEKAPLYDYINWRVSGGVGYNLGKTSVFGELHYGQSLPSRNAPTMLPPIGLDYLGGSLGVQGAFTQRLSGMAKAGYEVHSYRDGSSAPGSVVVDVSLNHRFRENTSSGLFYNRNMYLSAEVAGVNYNVDAVGLLVNQRFGAEGRIQARARAALQWDDYSKSKTLSNRSDVWYRINLDLIYLIRAWWQAGLSYEFEIFESNYRGLMDYDVNRVTFFTAIGY